MDVYQALVTTHILATAIGVGGATVSDILFFRAIRDDVISTEELSTLQMMTKIVMTGFILLLISGFGFLLYYYLTTGSLANLPEKVWAKLTIVMIIFLNSLILHHKVMPIFKDNVDKNIFGVLEKSKLILSAGAISGTSWYTALILGSWRGLETSYIIIMWIYLIAVFSAIFTANLIGFKRLRKFYTIHKKEPTDL